MDAALTFGALVGGAIWVGGFVCVTVVTRIVRAKFAPADRVVFFRALGRIWGSVSLAGFAVAGLCGALLFARAGGDRRATLIALLAALVLLVTGAGIVQARRMTRLHTEVGRGDRARAAALPRAATRALALRGLIGLLTFALVAAVALRIT